MEKHPALATLSVKAPCSESWDQMAGDRRARFCSHCQRHVHDLSALTANEAEKLLCESAGRLCVRFQKTLDGKLVTLDYQPVHGTRKTWKLWAIIGACIASVAGGAVYARLLQKKQLTCTYLGDSMFIMPVLQAPPPESQNEP